MKEGSYMIKKLSLTGGSILQNAIKLFQNNQSKETLALIFSYLKESEVWVSVCAEFVDNSFDEEAVVREKAMELMPFYAETKNGERFLQAFSGLNQVPDDFSYNLIKISFLDCMSWALHWPKSKGIVLDFPTNPFFIHRDSFDTIATISSNIEDEYIYAKIRFKPGGRSYYYEALRSDLMIGDRVIVPYGQYDKPKIGTIIQIGKYTSDNLPHSYFSTKYIYRKTDEERTIPRKNLTVKALLQEAESYALIKNFIEQETSFSFDEYYNAIFAEEDAHYSSLGIDRTWPDPKVSTELRTTLEKAFETLFAELDKKKPVLVSNSVGKHYANELFDIYPNGWGYNGGPFLWAHLSREFSSIPLPLSPEELSQLFQKFISFIPFENDYQTTLIPDFFYQDYPRSITRFSAFQLLERLQKNLKQFNKTIEELQQKDFYHIPAEKIAAAFNKLVKITTLKGIVVQGTIVDFSFGNNGFAAFKVENERGTTDLTLDEISSLQTLDENASSDETNDPLYCFVGVSPLGRRGRNYWYIDDEQRTLPNTYVWVRMGRRNEEQLVYVDSVQYCTAANAPFAIEKTKRILRQATEEEIGVEIDTEE